jgi:cytochrome c peroxidase
VEAGSDGQACASCHFNAGADNRPKNSMSPGLNHVGEFPDTSTTFQATAGGSPRSGPNYTVNKADFPFTQFSDPNNHDSRIKFDTDDVMSSEGTFAGKFVSVEERRHNFDSCERGGEDPVFNVHGVRTRRVEPRNTPTMINAVFNFRNFWDGRANNIFNGSDPFGVRDPFATVIMKNPDGSANLDFPVFLFNSSLASQAVGPPLSDKEMSCEGRNFADLGVKLLPDRPLADQRVHPQDSVLAGLARAPGNGLKGTYADMVKAAFNDDFWSIPATQKFPVRKGLSSTFRDSPAVYTQMQANFSLFWGLAIQLFESTLVSDQAPYDLSPRDGTGFPTFSNLKPASLQKSATLGLKVFMNQTKDNPFPGANAGHCINCHTGSDFTGAGLVLQDAQATDGLVERMEMLDRGVALYDRGFYNIGVTRTENDIGVGGTDPFGNTLSMAREYKGFLATGTPTKDPFQVNPCIFFVLVDPLNCGTPPPATERDAVDGAVKTPGLRNVELTGPYFHNGGAASLEQVVDFYNRGQNFTNPQKDPNIGGPFGAGFTLGLTAAEKAGLVAFMKTLTDDRVRFERAPFDHPSLSLPDGHPRDENVVFGVRGNPKLGQDDFDAIPARGRFGRPTPLKPFADCLARNRFADAPRCPGLQ